MKCSEKYEIISESFRDSFDQMNELIVEPVLQIGAETFNFEIFLCCDYKVWIRSYIYIYIYKIDIAIYAYIDIYTYIATWLAKILPFT